MTLRSFIDKVSLIPSITTWTRLEPQPRDASMQRSLQAQVRDPLWFLARQWQVGEFLGDDAGSPIHATLAAEMRTITTYRPGFNPASTVPIDPTLPIEVHVEREPVMLQMRGSAQHGLYFENLIRHSTVASPTAVIAAFRAAFPIAPVSPDPTYAPPDALRFRSVAAGRVTDGEALYASVLAVAAGQTPAIPLPAEASNLGMPAVIAAFVAFRGQLVQRTYNRLRVAIDATRLRVRARLSESRRDHYCSKRQSFPAATSTGTPSPLKKPSQRQDKFPLQGKARRHRRQSSNRWHRSPRPPSTSSLTRSSSAACPTPAGGTSRMQ